MKIGVELGGNFITIHCINCQGKSYEYKVIFNF